ncbi:MAG: triose-phosphate isomerase [Pseudomonadota bacterium]
MRRKIIIGNWKMNKTVSETIRTLTELKGLLSGKQDVEIVVAPPFPSLNPAEIAAQGTPVQIAAQNVHFEESGPFTGEVSPAMLADAGARFVIIGHSERRTHFGETDSTVNRRIKAVLENDLTPIFCLGETKPQRQQGKTFDVIETQLREGLRGISDANAPRIIVAYEPVWAIGTGDTATPATAQEVHGFLREKLGALFRNEIAQEMRIIYGGSVNKENVRDLMSQPDIDGALVGGASLDARSFADIVQYGEST